VCAVAETLSAVGSTLFHFFESAHVIFVLKKIIVNCKFSLNKMGKSKKNKIKVNIGRKIPLDEQIVAGQEFKNFANCFEFF
jgi:hypothetical protein